MAMVVKDLPDTMVSPQTGKRGCAGASAVCRHLQGQNSDGGSAGLLSGER